MANIIGITGGIASGKSTVTAMIRESGYQVVDADALVHDLQAPGGALYQVLVEHFGKEILLADGQLNRPELAKRIFSDEEQAAWSSQVQGQIIRQALWDQREELAQREDLFFMDIPLLIEQDYLDWFDAIWLVYVDQEQQLKRLMARNALSEEDARKRLAAQLPLIDKRPYATLVLDNSGRMEELESQVRAALEAVKKPS